jgi:serine/threonine protein kinase
MNYCPTCRTTYNAGETFCSRDGTRLQPMHSDTGAESVVAAAGAPLPYLGQTLSGRYHILKLIGEGGMGMVYEAEHVPLGRRVAVKILRDDFSRQRDLVERFRQEAKGASRIGHPHIVDVLDFGTTPSGSHYFVMELLEGEDLSHALRRESRLPVARAIRIATQCCEALGAAHDKGIVHRDLKPANIFLVQRPTLSDLGNERETTTDRRADRARPDNLEGPHESLDFVKIVDFGVAKMSLLDNDGAAAKKLTQTGMIFGTPEYMSPEQAAGKPIDGRADIYALGVMLYEMITGTVPFGAETFMGVLTQQLFESPAAFRDIAPNVACPASLEAVVRRALAKNPNERFQTMREMQYALTHLESLQASHAPRGADASMESSASVASTGRASPVATWIAWILVLGATVGWGSRCVYMRIRADAAASSPAMPATAPAATRAPTPTKSSRKPHARRGSEPPTGLQDASTSPASSVWPTSASKSADPGTPAPREEPTPPSATSTTESAPTATPDAPSLGDDAERIPLAAPPAGSIGQDLPEPR